MFTGDFDFLQLFFDDINHEGESVGPGLRGAASENRVRIMINIKIFKGPADHTDQTDGESAPVMLLGILCYSRNHFDLADNVYQKRKSTLK